MKGKIAKSGSGFRGVLNYCAAAVGAMHLQGSMSGGTPRELAAEFAAVRKLRPDIVKPVFHSPLSLPIGEEVDAAVWQRIAVRYLALLGFPEDTLFTTYVHRDKGRAELHIIASRISLSGEVWHGQWSAFKCIEATQQLEREFGLSITPGLNGEDTPDQKAARKSRAAPAESLIKAAHRAARRGTKAMEMAQAAAIMKSILARSSTMVEFISSCKRAGVEIVVTMKPDGLTLQGLKVRPDGVAEWTSASKASKSLGYASVLAQIDKNSRLADQAAVAARQAVHAADVAAQSRVAARLRRRPPLLGSPAAPQAPALLPDAVHQEFHSMAQLDATKNPLHFLETPASRREGRALDDVALEEGEAARPDRAKRDQDEAGMELDAEMRSATQKQLTLARRSLVGELRASDDDAIERMIQRMTRLVVRVLTLGQVVLPPSDAERRAIVARHTISRIDDELRRRAKVAREADSRPQPAQSPVGPANSPGAGDFEARQRERQAQAARKAQAVPVPKFVVALGHDARQSVAGPAPIAVDEQSPVPVQRNLRDRG